MSWVGLWLNLHSTYSLVALFYLLQPIQSRKTWRSSFYTLTGLVFLILLSGLYSIDPDLPSLETDKRVDWIGAFLVTTSLVLIVFALGQGGIAPRQWATPCMSELKVFWDGYNYNILLRYHCTPHCWAHIHGPLHILAILPRKTVWRQQFSIFYFYASTAHENLSLDACQWPASRCYDHWIHNLVWICIMVILGSGMGLCILFDTLRHSLSHVGNIALLSKLQAIYSHAECRSYPSFACLRPNMQCFYRVDGGIYTACLACRSVYIENSFIFSLIKKKSPGCFQELER